METLKLRDRSNETGTIEVDQVGVLKGAGMGEINGEPAIFSGIVRFTRNGPYP